MNVIIANINKDFFLQLNPKLKIEERTKNTSVIRCHEKTFTSLKDKICEEGINPYAVMAW